MDDGGVNLVNAARFGLDEMIHLALHICLISDHVSSTLRVFETSRSGSEASI